jgi:hypothetical protein
MTITQQRLKCIKHTAIVVIARCGDARINLDNSLITYSPFCPKDYVHRPLYLG